MKRRLVRGLGVFVVAASVACSGQSPTMAPTPTTPAQPVPTPVGVLSVSGMVMDRSGQPIADVEVGLYRYNELVLEPPALVKSMATGPDGRYVLDNSDNQGTWIGAHKDGYRNYEGRLILLGHGDVVLNIVLDSR